MKRDCDIRSKTHCMIVYPDCLDHMKLINDLQHSSIPFDCCFSYILHDMDCNTDTGELKKPHYHIVFGLPRECSREAFIKRMRSCYDGLTDICFYEDNREHAIRYLIHMDDPDKFQYPQSSIVSYNMEYLRYIYKKRETDLYSDLQQIIDFIHYRYSIQNKDIFSMPSRDCVFDYCLKHGLVEVYRRYYPIINDILKEGITITYTGDENL